tara:strand:- start:373 stop:789 length:417 start_codon:yes stop_codon:yes gene_type:complete
VKRKTWLRLNTVADRNMDDGLKKVYEKEETKRRMQTNTNHELEMIKQQQKAEAPLFKDIDPRSGSDWDEKRMDIIGQNGNDGEHYNRGNWWGLADDWEDEPIEEDDAKYTGRNREMDATGMDDDDPNPKEGRRGNYEL